MDLESFTAVVFLGRQFVLVGVRVELLFHLVDLADVLEFVCLESVHDLFTDSAGFGFHVGVALHQSSKSVMFRSFLLDLRLVDWLFFIFFLLIIFFILFFLRRQIIKLVLIQIILILIFDFIQYICN